MADDKRGREKQARDEERRQVERDVDAELERGGEAEPPVDASDLDGLADALGSLDFPATGAAVVAAVGEREVASPGRTDRVEALIPDADGVTYDSPAAVRVRVKRPTVAAAMKRVVEAARTRPNVGLSGSQREAYEKTFRALEAIDGDDDDEGVRVVEEWIVDRIREEETPPGSRAVRREAASFCRANGYAVRDDDWLGV